MSDDVEKALEAAASAAAKTFQDGRLSPTMTGWPDVAAAAIAAFLRALPSEIHIAPLSLEWRTVPQGLRCADIRADGARVLWDELAAAVERAAREAD